MKTIVPLNISALRVNINDEKTKKTTGKIARFNKIDDQEFCTGDLIANWTELQQGSLKAGIHIHWELPDFFKKGIQRSGEGEILFPQAPNRWLVIRTLCKFDNGQWLSPKHQCWLIESDFISSKKPIGKKTNELTAIPLSCDGNQKFSYMGRVVKSGEKDDTKGRYLKDFKNVDGTSMYLTATGFLGPQFSSYYPDCCSVFGFHDSFEDNSVINKAIKSNEDIIFKASYQVIGWIDGSEDPMDIAIKQAQKEYDEYLKICKDTSVESKRSLIDFFIDFSEKTLGWDFNRDALDTLSLPDKTICNGIIQEIVWNKSDYFINKITYEGESRIAIGNTRSEAISALMKDDKKNLLEDDEQSKYEFLLNLFQAGKLDDLETRRNILSELENEMHHNNFVCEQSGLKWTISLDEMDEKPERQTYHVLPKKLDLQLNKLNKAQKTYDIKLRSLADLRKQLFMDWYTYAEYMRESKGTDLYEDIKKFNDEKLRPFIDLQLKEEKQKLGELGELKYEKVDNIIVSLSTINKNNNSIAYEVSQEFQKLLELMAIESSEMKLIAVPASSYYYPTEPVTVVETACLENINRNKDGLISVRTLNELINTLTIKSQEFETSVSASDFDNIKIEIPDSIKDTDLILTIKQLFAEAIMLIPSNSEIVANAFKNKEDAKNPACNNYEKFIISLKLLQGGQSKLDVKSETSGLFETIRNQEPILNPEEHTESPLPISLIFTNDKKLAITPDSVGWNCQEYYNVSNSFQPFNPLFLNWEVTSKSLIQNDYHKNSINDYFELDRDENNYKLKKNITIETNDYIIYKGSSILLKNNVQNFLERISKMIESTNSGLLQKQHNSLKSRKIISIDLNGLKENQLMKKLLPAWDISEDSDKITNELMTQITDVWRIQGFNNESPKREGFKNESQKNETKFHPIRDGYLDILKIEFIDVFGQRMQLSTKSEFMKVIPAQSLTDGKNTDKVFFHPRLLLPAQINVAWNRDGDITSPIWGWIVPDNLNNNLFFYNETGKPIGSFGIEHGKIVYRPCPSKMIKNSLSITDSDLLIKDIGERGKPKINKKLAAFMWYVYSNNKTFSELFLSINNSYKHIDGNNSLKDGSLSVLIGRPIALSTTILKMETAGNVLPVNQVYNAWEKDVVQSRNYTQRIERNSANLGNVQFPLHIGDKLDTNDGLIGYKIEEKSQDLYTEGGFELLYSSKDVKGEIMIKLNETFNITVIFDPNSSIHFKSGILPVSSLCIEQELYTVLVNKLDVVFPTYQVLKQYNQFDITMPEQDKFSWLWIYPDLRPDMLLNKDSSTMIDYGYSPQTIEEGWLKLEHDKENEK